MESIAVLPWLTHFVHLLAAIVWIGGLAYHFPVMKSSLRNLDAAAARRMSSVAFVRFRMISLLAIAAVALTGLHMAAGIVRGTGPATAETGGFFGSPYGLILGLKIALGLAAVATGGFAGFVLAPRLVAALEDRDEERVRSTGRRIDAAGVACLVLGTLVAACVTLLRVTS